MVLPVWCLHVSRLRGFSRIGGRVADSGRWHEPAHRGFRAHRARAGFDYGALIHARGGPVSAPRARPLPGHTRRSFDCPLYLRTESGRLVYRSFFVALGLLRQRAPRPDRDGNDLVHPPRLSAARGEPPHRLGGHLRSLRLASAAVAGPGMGRPKRLEGTADSGAANRIGDSAVVSSCWSNCA